MIAKNILLSYELVDRNVNHSTHAVGCMEIQPKIQDIRCYCIDDTIIQ